MVNFLWDRGRPRPPVAQKASGRKLFVLRSRAARAPAVPVAPSKLRKRLSAIRPNDMLGASAGVFSVISSVTALVSRRL